MRGDPRRPRPLKSPPPGHFQFETVAWTPACADHRTPESLLADAEEARDARARDEQHMALVAGLPAIEAMIVTLANGLFGQRPHTVRQIACLLVMTEAEVAGVVDRARMHASQKASAA